MENAAKTQVLRWKQLKTQRELSLAWEPIEKQRKNAGLVWKQWNAQGKHRFRVGTLGIYRKHDENNGKHTENSGFAWEPTKKHWFYSGFHILETKL